MSLDWWKRHLNGGDEQPQVGRPQPVRPTAHQGPPAGYQPPPGYQLVPVQQQQQQVPAQRFPWEQPQHPEELPYVDTSTIPKGYVNPTNFMEMAQYYRGGDGNRAAQPCPACGGPLFRKMWMGKECAPECTQCSWNGYFSQGEQAAAGAVITPGR